MLRIPVRSRYFSPKYASTRLQSSSSYIRSTFIKYFEENHDHKFIKSSSVVPLCDPTLPFVNAGMNQFKGVFLGTIQPPCTRAVNSQKCIRVGGKHNDLDIVGTDGHHHTFFEMLGNWSFGDYYKKEACQMAWDLLLGPYRLKPENLLVTYFGGDAVIGLPEDRACRDVWREIGVPPSRLKDMGAKDNFWEMGATGPCGPCTEIHYVHPDGSLTELWNIVFIHCYRDASGKVFGLGSHHVDTGCGLERLVALLQNKTNNYDTDLFQPIIRAIERKSKSVSPYVSTFDSSATLSTAYRRLADHARMISVCLAGDVYPATSLNLKQILRKSIRLSTDVFNTERGMLAHLYDSVAETLSPAYPELVTRRKEALLVLEYEEESYLKLRSSLKKKWKGLVKEYPEVEALSDIELAGFALGYKELKETMSKQPTATIPGELVFKLYDTHGFQEHHIDRIAQLNNYEIDKKTFWKLLKQHRSKHKTAFKQQADKKGQLFDEAIKRIEKDNLITRTDDSYKYNYKVQDGGVLFEPIKSSVVGILNEQAEWIDCLEPCDYEPYYLVTKDSNFFCEEGGQSADTGLIKVSENMWFNVESAFKIRDFVFHKGYFKIAENTYSNYISTGSEVLMFINSEQRLNTMRNHTAIHLLNAAIRVALPNSVVTQVGSSVTDDRCILNLSVYGEKLSQEVLKNTQKLVRAAIKANVPVTTRTLDSVQLSFEENIVTVPAEIYPERGLRLVHAETGGLLSKELCCGTHAPSTGMLQDFCITLVKSAGSTAPAVHAVTGTLAKEAHELICRADKLEQVINLIDPERLNQECSDIKARLTSIAGPYGTPALDLATCLRKLDKLGKLVCQPTGEDNDGHLLEVAKTEVLELTAQTINSGGKFLVHFLRCSYLMQSADVTSSLAVCTGTPAMLFGCANGIIHVACTVPKNLVTKELTAAKWLSSVLPVFQASILPARPGNSLATLAEMSGTKVSLITCEQMVQDAMRAAIAYAKTHATTIDTTNTDRDNDEVNDEKDRRTN